MRIPELLLKLIGLCVVAGVLVAGVSFPVVGGMGLVSNQASTTVETTSSDLINDQPPLMSTITDKDNRPIAYFYDGQYRFPTAPDQISDAMKAAIIAIEDKRFFSHDGVDWQGTLRAAATNQIKGEISQGASTITQQYVKNYMIYVEAKGDPLAQERARAQTIARKLREIRIALQLEKTLSKQEILTRYLNIVFFGHKAYGIGAAAKTYFGTTPDKLTIAQSALLAGMVNSTTAYDPVNKPQQALQRRNLVIEQMRKQKMITSKQAQQATAEPIGIVNPLQSQDSGCIAAAENTGFFCAYVADYLSKVGVSDEALKTGGYTIKTTLDRGIQDKVKKSILGQVPKSAPHVANTMSVIRPGKDAHKVVAMSANRSYGLDKEQHETVRTLPAELQPFGSGSIFKLFTTAAYLEGGGGLNDTITAPEPLRSPVYDKAVTNVGSPPATMPITEMLKKSPNTHFIKMEEKTGVDAAVDMATRLGLRSMATAKTLQPVSEPKPSIAEYYKKYDLGSFTLGTVPTQGVELSNVAATLGSDGVWCPPSPIREVVGPNGSQVPLQEKPCEQVVTPQLAHTMLQGMSQDDAPGGTSFGAAQQTGWKRPVAAKTGTTNTNKSTGFLAITPQLAGSVFTFDDTSSPSTLCDAGFGQAPYPCSSNKGLYGGNTPARTFYTGMKDILGGAPPKPLPTGEAPYLGGHALPIAPDVRGQKVDAAKKALTDAGYTVERAKFSSEKARDTVVAQSPMGNLNKGKKVKLWVSTGYVPPPPETQLKQGRSSNEGKPDARPNSGG